MQYIKNVRTGDQAWTVVVVQPWREPSIVHSTVWGSEKDANETADFLRTSTYIHPEDEVYVIPAFLCLR